MRSQTMTTMSVSALLLIAGTALGQIGADNEDNRNESLGDRIHQFASQEAMRYEVAVEGASRELERFPESLLKWSNLTRQTAYGDTYIWTDRGCARAVVSIYALGPPVNMLHLEFQSLSEDPLIVRRGDRVIWNPQTPGVSLQPVPGVSKVSKSASLRLTQMNAIARSFRADFAPHETPGEFNELRLLPKPLYRYESRSADVIDGAVYGFVEATDPELLLVIEAHAGTDSPSWVYSGARSRHDHLRLYRRGQVVWESEQLAPPWENMRRPEGPYFNERWTVIAEPEEQPQLDALFSTKTTDES